MGGTCSRNERDEICIQDFGRKNWKIPLGRGRRRREDNIKINLEDVDYIYLSQERVRYRALVNTEMKLLVP